jgi:competence protein ComEC
MATAIDRNHASVAELASGQVLAPDDRVVLETLRPSASPPNSSPSHRNNNALGFQLVYDEVSFLLTTNIEAETEIQLVRNSPGLDADVLKAAHHGSKTFTTPAFLEAASPTVVVISAGADNRYARPNTEVLTRLGQAVSADRVYQPAQQGRIEFVTDGYRLWVESQG